MYYTGEGQVGDQKMWKGNQAINTASDRGVDIHLFVRFKKTEYTYFGIVEVVDEPFFADEKDVNGNMRKVIKFPMMQRTSVRNLTQYENIRTVSAGISP